MSCVGILSGEEFTADLGYALAGPHSIQVLNGREGGVEGYWPKVWALGGLLYAWDSAASPVVIKQLSDESWRVRQMALKVIARRRIDEALESVASRQSDSISRVRSAAQRALVALSIAKN